MPYDKKSYLLFSTNKDYSIYQLDSLSVLTGLRERKGYQLVYSHFLHSNTNYVVYPDYLADEVQNETQTLIEISSHNFVSKNPFVRLEKRYEILEKLI